MNDDFASIFIQYLKDRIPFITVTLVDIKGSAPQNIGAKMIVSKNGLEQGTIGGGRIEAHALSHCSSFFKQDKKSKQSFSQFQEINLQKDIGMSCGGVIKLFYDLHNINNWDIQIFGAGHISQALCKILLTLNCNITVTDERLDWINKLPKSPKITTFHSIEDNNLIHCDSFILIMTKGHSTDLPILKRLHQFNLNFRFLGVIGSTTKSSRIKQELVNDNISPYFIEQIICPMGEKIGSNSPAEIAISITAQLLKYRKSSN